MERPDYKTNSFRNINPQKGKRDVDIEECSVEVQKNDCSTFKGSAQLHSAYVSQFYPEENYECFFIKGFALNQHKQLKLYFLNYYSNNSNKKILFLFVIYLVNTCEHEF